MRTTKYKKTKIIFLGFALFLCLLSFSFTEKGPKIKFKEESFDFGRIKQGKVLTYVFVIRNEGDQTLKINKVSSSCGCTAALVSERRIAPGGEGELKVTFNSAGFQGKVAKYVYVESNDPAQPKKQLTISAEIEVPPQPKIHLDRYTSDEGLFLEGEEIRTKTSIRNRGELELRVNCSHKDAMFFSGEKEVSFPLKIASGKSVELEVRIPPRKKRGLIREYILIKSNDPSRQTLSFYLSGYIITKEQLKKLFAKYKDILD